MNSRISIDNLIEIIKTGGKVKTGVDIYNSDGTLLLEKDYNNAADLFIFPSRIEGLPNTILEALSCNIPIVSTPVGEIEHYVSNTYTEVADFVEYIIGENWLPEELPSWFPWDEQVKNYINLFHRLITKSS
mgnify:CR=1 FL=1